MNKQYVSTVSASNAHQLDITGLAITKKYTITVLSDGYAAFWDNKIDEVDDPNDHVHKILINDIGIHHVAVGETTLVQDGNPVKAAVLAFACFDGSVQLAKYRGDVSTFEVIDTQKQFASGYWCPQFYMSSVEPLRLIVTQANGNTEVFELTVLPQLDVELSLQGTIKGTAFPNTLGVTPETSQVAIGYTNGDVVLYNLGSLKPIYTFSSTDLRADSGSIARQVVFSPGGTLLAVARDNQSAGTITLYDVKYGENVGLLTTPTHSAKTSIGGFAHDGWIMGLSFNTTGKLLVSGGFDKCIRVWNISLRERVSTIKITTSDLDAPDESDADDSVVSGVVFIDPGVRGGAGADSNDGLCVVSFDRGVRWYREAGGI